MRDRNQYIDPVDDILIGDNGSFVFTQYEQEANDHFHMNTYYIDLSSESMEPILVYENEVKKKKNDIFFNHDASAIYIAENGMLQIVELQP
ncbi:hypothetical protein GI584_15340 [Gracilibacillus salitolerans]|uniref:Uncharacterized protein n=1 Tax=Gracilibacillus salitolerans TaxID=2663022 RepID=A0A5Q2TNB3_9BACI|nr:hypothetical protein [Gracilibacillus salitolerans]QGH35340.1 hypothetical protein GI584_15340 [Gracilibacillus salitolerans]